MLRFSIFVIFKLILLEDIFCKNYYSLKTCGQISDSSVIYSLEYDGGPAVSVKNKTIDPSKIINSIKVEVSSEGKRSTSGITHIKVTDAASDRYEVPRGVFSDEYNNEISKNSSKNISCQKLENKLALSIYGTEGENEVFSIFNEDLLLTDDYLIFDYKFPSNYIFGYGERANKFRLTNGTYTIYPNETGGSHLEDGLGGKNSYGFHPFLLIKNKNSFSGILFVNTNAQDLIIDNYANNQTKAHQITIGGIIELLAWSRSSAIETIKLYHAIIGRPTLVPYWAMGWHQSRWGYSGTQELIDIVNNYAKYKIPIDTIWSDIDYMNKYEDFSIDPERFGHLGSFVDTLHKKGMRYVPIVDMGIKMDSVFFAYGESLGVLTISNYTKKTLINDVWPGACGFPDFMSGNKSYEFWSQGLKTLGVYVDYDGLWLDMNEPGVFKTGEEDFIKMDPKFNYYNNLSYVPGNERIDLNNHGLSINARYTEGSFFNLKTVNTFYQNKITNTYLKSINKRPFILSRSTLFGMGKFSFHWLGDNFSTYESFRGSVLDIFNAQMFGFSIVGSDICGFNNNTSDELCSRWTVLGSFYPFSRNHANIDSIHQEPWALGPLTMNANKNAIPIRYSLLRYYYTQFFKMSLDGGVVFQPMFFQFDNDLYIDNDKVLSRQIMIGPALLFLPAMDEATEDFEGYFPNGNWNKLPTGEKIVSFDEATLNSTVIKPVPGAYGEVNLYLRGGCIIPYQNATNGIRNTKDILNKTISIIVLPDQNGRASGELIYDDTDSNPDETISGKAYLHIQIEYNHTSHLSFNVLNDYDYTGEDAYVSEIRIFNNSLLSNNSVKKKANNLRFLSQEYEDEHHNKIIKFNKPIHVKELKSFEI